MMTATDAPTEASKAEATAEARGLHMGGDPDRGAARLAAAQGWACAACGITIAGGAGTIRLATVADGSADVAVLLHEAGADDAWMVHTLGDVPEVAVDAGGADAEAAERARIGALMTAVDEARGLLARLPVTAQAMGAPPEAPAAAQGAAGRPSELAPVRNPDGGPGGVSLT